MAPKRQKCPTCGSKQWHKEPSSGLVSCSEGHILQNYRNETTEITEVGPHAMKKRTLKSGKEKKAKTSQRDPKLYHGARSRTHYFLCLQLVLRKQIVALVKLWDLPSEFEVICKDLWTLHLASLSNPLPEPDTDSSELGADVDGKLKEKNVDEADSDADEDDEEADGDHEAPIQGNQKGKQKEQDLQSESEEDSELEALMRENSDFSSSDSDSDSDSEEEGVKKTQRRNRKGHPPSERPLITLSILIVACWILRIPILYRDFTTLIKSYKLPYLSPLLFLPPTLTRPLTKHKISALSPAHAPDTLSMHRAASRFAKRAFEDWGISVPEANAAGVVWRVVRGFGGGPTLYTLTKRVLSALSMPLTLSSVFAPGLERTKGSDPLSHRYDDAPAEVQVLVGVIVVLKMVYGLDGVVRQPEDEEDVAHGLLDKASYIRLIERVIEEEKSKELKQVGEMDEEEMDEYMGFCERVLVRRGSEPSEGVLDGYFGHLKGGMEEKKMAQKEADVGIREEEKEGEGPGTGYKLWNEGVGEYGLVVGLGSEFVGVSEGYVCSVVVSSERKLRRDVMS